MVGRAAGNTCKSATNLLNPEVESGYLIPFNPRGGGCGAAMRAVPIGLLYWRPEETDSLVRVAIEAGRMTHNHPTGLVATERERERESSAMLSVGSWGLWP